MLIEQSGWSDAFVTADSIELEDEEKGTYSITYFEYPIEQDSLVSDNTFSFITYFSKENNSNLIIIRFVPDYKIIILVSLFLASPFWVYLIRLPKTQKKRKLSQKSRNPTFEKIKSFLLVLSKSYSIPLVTIGIYFGFGASDFLPMLGYLTEIMNPLVLTFVLIYPTLVSIAYYVWKSAR